MNQTHVIKTLINVTKKKASGLSLWSMDAGTEIVGLGDRRRGETLAKKDAYGSKYKLIVFWLNVLFSYFHYQLEPQTDLCEAVATL